jgi:FkbM family methyltransferase
VLCDPLFSRYDRLNVRSGFKLIETAIGDREGHVDIKISTNLYGSSLICRDDAAEEAEMITVPITTVDALFREQKLQGRGLLKADVQFAEHMVINGALRTLASIDCVILELTMKKIHPEAKTFLEMCNRMRELGFEAFDVVGHWRAPSTGLLEQLDVAFISRRLAREFARDQHTKN